MAVLGRWWNGVWGRLGRRDIWLSINYRVTARQGNSEHGKVLRWDFESEDAARSMVDRLTTADGPGEWREMDSSKAGSAPSAPESQSG
ncbi:hypothetical protein [Actinoplanes sp. NPDC026619]|uniref:hypothetical protein n=1 Tax=Actinoplanes sp. NPDC026619 TaxID=3155798 RepID=UPI0033DCE9C3